MRFWLVVLAGVVILSTVVDTKCRARLHRVRATAVVVDLDFRDVGGRASAASTAPSSPISSHRSGCRGVGVDLRGAGFSASRSSVTAGSTS